MSSDRWRRIEAIFDAARSRPPADRDAYVAEAAAGDESLRREIISLLQQPSSAFIDGTVGGAISAETTDERSLVGRRVGAYEVIEMRGSGGMGRVYRARDSRLGRDVALKVLSRAFADIDSVPRLEREARTLASLNHPHIGAIYGLEEIDGAPALVLELIDGPTLASRLAGGPLPLDDVRRYGAQIADALAEAHAAGIVHRDLKPSNVMLTRNGAKVVDFGLAKAVTSREGTITHSGVVPGTPAYVAPEQLDSRNVDPRSDLFALGLVLYEMATGQLPMPGASFGTVLKKGAVAIPRASRLRSAVSPALDDLIVRLLQKDPTRRPISAAVVRDQLRDMEALPSQRRRLDLAIAGMVLAIAMTVWWTIGGRGSMALRPTRVSAVVLLPGVKQDPALSPDGSTLAFSWDGANGNQPGVYTVDVNGGDAQQLTHGPSSDVSPVWAPDGRLVAFLRLHPGGASELMVVPAKGGPERKLSDVRMTEILRRSLRPLLGWTGDGSGLIVPIEDAETQRVSLFEVGLHGGERVRLVAASSGLGPTQPTVSRDGRWMAYASRDPRRLGVQAIDANGAPRGEFEYAGDRLGGQSPSLSPDGTELLFASGTEILQWSARTKTVHVVYVSPHPIQAMTVSWAADGGPRVVFSSESNQTEIRATAVTGGGRSLADAAGTFVQAGAAPSFSPDGRWLVFDGGPLPSVAAIWLADSDGKRARPLTVKGFSRASWSHDGRRLAFHGGPRSQIYVLDIDPEREIARPQGMLPVTPARPLTDLPFGVISPDWSADDRFLYVTRPGTTYRVMRVSVKGGTVEDLFEGGFKRLDPSRRRIYYGKSDQFGIFVRSLDGDVRSNPEERLVWDYVPPRGFDVSKRGIFYVGRDANRNPTAMRFFDFATRTSSHLAPPPLGKIPTITVSPDGGRLLFDTDANPASNLTLMQLSRSAG